MWETQASKVSSAKGRCGPGSPTASSRRAAVADAPAPGPPVRGPPRPAGVPRSGRAVLEQQAVAAAEIQYPPVSGDPVAHDLVAGPAVRGAATGERVRRHRRPLGVEGPQEGFLRCRRHTREPIRRAGHQVGGLTPPDSDHGNPGETGSGMSNIQIFPRRGWPRPAGGPEGERRIERSRCGAPQGERESP